MTDVQVESVHSTVDRYAVEGHQLLVGGLPVALLAERVGDTPFFAYDRDKISGRVTELRDALPDAVRLSYAIKANPMPAVVQHLSALVDHLDVASVGEMRVALDTGMAPGAVSFAGPGKRAGEIRQAVAAGVVIELESMTEANRVIAAGAELGIRSRVAVRVNPDFDVRGSGMRMGGGPQQFGVDAEEIASLLGHLRTADVDLVGFHVFAGSQNLHADLLAVAQAKTVELLVRLAQEAPQPVTYVNLGGGFGIPYTQRDTPLDLAAVGRALGSLITDRLATELPRAEVVIELGRYLVGEAGVYVTRIVDRKESRGRTYLVVDGGLHHQLAASGNFGAAIRRNYPLVVGTQMGVEDTETVSVVGCLCTPLDLLGDQVILPRAEVGDLVVLFQAGAYGLTASPTAFLGHPHPTEVLV